MRIRKLDSLRGIAVMIVLVSHYSNFTNFLGGVLGNGAGQYGVMLFFILSGYLMSTIYLGKEFTQVTVKNFVVARFARIVPLYFLIVVLSFVFRTYIIPGNLYLYSITSVKSLLTHLMFLSGISVFWTIPVEVQFYALFILVWWVFSRNKGYGFIILLCLAMYAMFFPGRVPSWELFGFKVRILIINNYLLYFLAGTVLGQLKSRWEAPAYLRKNVFFLSILFLIVLYPGIFQILTGQFLGGTDKLWIDLRIFLAISSVFFILIFLVPDNSKLLSNPIGDFLGNISYSVYLLHICVLNSILPFAKGNPWLFFFPFIALTLLVSFLSYKLFELPTQKAIRFVAYPQKHGRAQ